MITFKQMEAVVWVAELGSFEAAANKLHTSQSAISKRIHELEASLGILLFDRSGRSAYLTDKGKELVDLGSDLLQRRDELITRLSGDTAIPHRFRIGVTELTGLTWLPNLIRCIRERYPHLKVEPSIELSRSLFEKLENDQLDMIIAPDNVHDERFTRVPLSKVENAWMCSEHISTERKLSLHELDKFNVLTQGSDSGTGMIYDRWLSNRGIRFSRTLRSDYLLAQVGMTLAGLGISYIPCSCFEFLTQQGMLQVLDVSPGLPAIQYVAMFRTLRHNTLNETIVGIALEHCNFSELFFSSIRT